MTDEEPKKNEGTFVCKCLWSGTLSFSSEEMNDLDGDIKRYMGPCPECGRNSLQLAQDPAAGHRGIDALLDEMEAAADPVGDKEDRDV